MNSSDEIVNDADSSERRARRIMALLSLWRSSNELGGLPPIPNKTLTHNNQILLGQEQSDNDACDNNVTSNLNPDPPSGTSGHNRQHQLLGLHHALPLPHDSGHLSPLVIPYAPLTVSETTSRAGENAISKRRLFQSLLLPILLGLMIFLTALCSHQISLYAMSYDALVLLIGLTIIMIAMSGVAIWSTYNDHGFDSNITDMALAANGCDLHLHNYFNESNMNNRISDLVSNRFNQLGNVSVIDCKPPDYYNALRNSRPLTKASSSDSNYRNLLNGESNDISSSPPKYNDLTNLT